MSQDVKHSTLTLPSVAWRSGWPKSIRIVSAFMPSTRSRIASIGRLRATELLTACLERGIADGARITIRIAVQSKSLLR